MKRNIFALLRTFVLAAFVPALSLSLVSCEPENESDNEDTTDNLESSDTSDYEAVDLGLSVKWASCNVGATVPEEYGGYYAWGETEEKTDCSWTTYKWCNGSEYSMTKYCTDSHWGTVDNKITLDPEDDVAHVKWGGGWRMPTLSEIQELCNDCSWEWTSVNGVNGYKVIGTNGNSIFLPAAGNGGADAEDFRGMFGSYWSATLGNMGCQGANDLSFHYSGRRECSGTYRYVTCTVRPVSE